MAALWARNGHCSTVTHLVNPVLTVSTVHNNLNICSQFELHNKFIYNSVLWMHLSYIVNIYPNATLYLVGYTSPLTFIYKMKYLKQAKTLKQKQHFLLLNSLRVRFIYTERFFFFIWDPNCSLQYVYSSCLYKPFIQNYIYLELTQTDFCLAKVKLK